MKYIYLLISILLCINVYGQTDSARLVYEKKVKRALSNEADFRISANNFKTNGKSFISPYPSFAVAIGLYRVRAEYEWSGFTNPNDLYYTYGSSPTRYSTNYNYTTSLSSFTVSLLIARLKINQSAVNIYSGWSYEHYHVDDVKLTDIPAGIFNTSSFTSITQMGNTETNQVFVEAERFFWIANQQLSIGITGYVPFSVKDDQPSYGYTNFYSPQTRKMLQLNIRLFFPTFSYNPYKSKTL